MLINIKRKARVYSPWIFHAHAGGCNNCDIELAACFAPRYDLERMGIQLRNNPRHADILIITGPVTKQISSSLRRIFDQVPNPKVVVACGSCALTGGVYNRDDGKPNYALAGPVEKLIPIDVSVPGCPPKPESIIDGVMLALEKLKEK
ncbi:NADH-quinone oxidoreductase subunit NuoB [Candidatus Bathyarchaeota archaeon]|nr:NADH-quinone oxidoreductase subunit NuoB [Candidatus Bathyarchaeota archaeon]